jgi:hypothetical protein
MGTRMKIGRTMPPAAAPLGWLDLWHGIAGVFRPERLLRALEDGLREEFGVRHVFLVSSGKAALMVTLKALRSLSPRREVVTPAYTCFSVPAAIVHAGLRPAPCDIDPSTFDFDHALLERTLTDDTLCVIAHHLFGVPSAIDRIRALCEAQHIFVVEDAAQAMGTESGGRKLGTLGDVGIFSLGRGKNITCGSGGIIVTNSDRIADAIALEYRQLLHPAAAVLDPGGVALSRAGPDDLPEEDPGRASLGHESRPSPGLALASGAIQQGPIRDGPLFQPPAAGADRRRMSGSVPAVPDRPPDADGAGDAPCAIAGTRARTLRRLSDAGERHSGNRALLQRPTISFRQEDRRASADAPDAPLALGERQERHHGAVPRFSGRLT